ncbi:MAG: zinc dependent phospholipase C family protein [Ruminococcus sp.]|nr:zinc dependent phospholipase C family protein [Ruminococcus sp.]
MPSAIVHLKAAFDLAERLKVQNLGQFYLGAVSPDAVNLDGFAGQEVRYPAHIRTLDYGEWKQNARDFYKANEKSFADDPDFLKGFLLHIFTDIYWDELAQPILFSALKAQGAKDEQLRELKWQELYRFNSYLQGEWLYNDVLPKLREAKALPITTVSGELLDKYRQHLCDDYMDKKSIDEKPLICNESMIERVEQACTEEFDKLC